MEQNQSLFSLSIDPITKSHLIDTAKWAKFLAIAGMVLLALGIVFSILALTVLPDAASSAFTINGTERENAYGAVAAGTIIGMLVLVLVAFFPLLFLLQFANKLKKALVANHQEDLNTAFQSLKKHFRYVGIVLIIVLAIYGLVFVLAILGNAGN